MSAHADAHEHGHGPPQANQSSRIAPTVLGMLLFIASEAMLFGSFFAALFFARVVNPGAPGHWPPEPFHFPIFVAGVNTCILVTSSFTMHWAVQSIRAERSSGPEGRADADHPARRRLSAHPGDRVCARRLQHG